LCSGENFHIVIYSYSSRVKVANTSIEKHAISP